MTRTPDEIKKGLACCAASIYQCEDDCPYREGCRSGEGWMAMNKDALALIQQLEAERDAAIETIYEMEKCITDACEWCDGVECERLCMMHLTERPGFKWRGVQKEDSDA